MIQWPTPATVLVTQSQRLVQCYYYDEEKEREVWYLGWRCDEDGDLSTRMWQDWIALNDLRQFTGPFPR